EHDRVEHARERDQGEDQREPGEDAIDQDERRTYAAVSIHVHAQARGRRLDRTRVVVAVGAWLQLDFIARRLGSPWQRSPGRAEKDVVPLNVEDLTDQSDVQILTVLGRGNRVADVTAGPREERGWCHRFTWGAEPPATDDRVAKPRRIAAVRRQRNGF